MSRNLWLVFVTLAGLAWGTYVPLIAYGGSELGGKPEARLLAILCVGVAYFCLGVIYPLIYLLRLPTAAQPERTVTGLFFSGLAGGVGPLAVASARKVQRLGMLAQLTEAGNAIQRDAADPRLARPG